MSNICDEIINNLENNEITCAIFLDLAKAFDTVNHAVLYYFKNFIHMAFEELHLISLKVILKTENITRLHMGFLRGWKM